MKINIHSWHYAVVEWAYGTVDDITTLCQYVGRVLASCAGLVVCVLGVVIVVSFFLILLLDPIISTILCFVFDVPFIPFFSETSVAAGIALWFGAGIITIEELYKRRKRERPPGILRVRYNAWKEKHCPLVEFEEKF